MAAPLQTKIMVFGTFDVLHPGHIHFFRQARRLAKKPYLIVSVARDVNVKKIKGQKPRHNERARLKKLAACGLVNKAILGGLRSYLPHILKESPSLIALGYDQTVYVKGLKAKLKQKGLQVKVFRLKSHRPHVYKTSKLTPL